MGRPRENTEYRFWSFVKKTKHCWIWTGSKLRAYETRHGGAGYGQFSNIENNGKKKNWRAHRFSYFLHFGKIPKGMLVCHRCDNPACVNPKHLFLGSWKDNANDMINKGRKFDTSCENNGQSKISMEIAKEIRALYFSKIEMRYKKGNPYSQYKLAEKYKLTQSVVSRIINNKGWIEK